MLTRRPLLLLQSVRDTGTQALFQHQFPQLNVQRTVFSKRHILHYRGFSYHFIYICIFVPCDLFLIAFIAGRSLLNEICTTLFQTTHVLLFGNI